MQRRRSDDAGSDDEADAGLQPPRKQRKQRPCYSCAGKSELIHTIAGAGSSLELQAVDSEVESETRALGTKELMQDLTQNVADSR